MFFALLAAASSIAAPVVEKRADFDAPEGGDITILNYALTLEFLERKFYQEGLEKYNALDFITAGLPYVRLHPSLYPSHSPNIPTY